MILSDRQIKHLNAIDPYVPYLVSAKGDRKILSYGQSSFGYDIRLSPVDFKIFRYLPSEVIDPKNFNLEILESLPVKSDGFNEYFLLPPRSYGLGTSLEKVKVPKDVSVVCLGKSTYARIGLIANITPLEPEWEGHITLEFSNASASNIRLYANEGVIQLQFFQGEECSISYADRHGKYQGQPEKVVVAKV